MKIIRKAGLASSLLLLIGFGQSTIAQGGPQKDPFGVGVYDHYGYVAWEDVGAIPRECVVGKELIKRGKYIEAISKFRAVLGQYPSEPSAFQGYAESMRKLGKLPKLYHEFGEKINKYVRNRLRPTDELILFYQYIMSMIVAESNRGDTAMRNFDGHNPRTPGGNAMGFLVEPIQWQKMAKPFWVMYLSGLSARSEIAKARATAKEMLRVNPGFVQVRLLYAIDFTWGSASKWDQANQRWSDSPKDQQMNPSEALKQAKEVYRQAPNWLPGIYILGVCAYRLDPPLAKRMFNLYVQKAGHDDRKLEKAKRFLGRLKDR